MTRHWLKPEHSDEWAEQGRRVWRRALRAARGRVLAAVDDDARRLERRVPHGPVDFETWARSVGNGRARQRDLGDHQ